MDADVDRRIAGYADSRTMKLFYRHGQVLLEDMGTGFDI
jgi:hypothetical protein